MFSLSCYLNHCFSNWLEQLINNKLTNINMKNRHFWKNVSSPSELNAGVLLQQAVRSRWPPLPPLLPLPPPPCGTAGVCSGQSCWCSSWGSRRKRTDGCCGETKRASSGRTSSANIYRTPDTRRASLLGGQGMKEIEKSELDFKMCVESVTGPDD